MNRTWKVILLASLAAVLLSAALTGAQTPAPADTTAVEKVALSEQLLGFFGRESVAVLAAVIVPLIWKFFPAFKNFSNEWAPVLAAVSAFVVHALTPAEAYSSIFGDIFRTSAGILFPVARAAVDSVISKWTFEHFLRGPTTVHWQKPLPDGQ